MVCWDGIGALYVSVFGNWVPSIQTLSFVLITTPICFVLGLSFGIWGYLDKSRDSITACIKHNADNATVCISGSHYCSLWIGDHAGSIATIIIATPPMIRNTILGLKRISPEVVEAGLMSGCTKRQLLFKVLIPTARRDILNGVNTVIMQCLAMVVIASFVGANGLGLNLKVALNSLKLEKLLKLVYVLFLLPLFLIDTQKLGLISQ